MLTQTSFAVPTTGTVGGGKTQKEMERQRIPGALKQRVLRPNHCLCSRRRKFK